MILVLAGTKDGRIIAEELFKMRFEVMATAVTSYGNRFSDGIKAYIGALNEEKLYILIKNRDIDVVVDVTHPFAEEISKTAIKVCQQLKIPYLRYERKSLEDRIDGVIWARDFNHAAVESKKFNRIFLAIGSKNLDKFLPLKTQGKKIFARVLPISTIIKRCEDLGFTCSDIIAIQGPFSYEMNIALFKQTRCDVVVTKESGEVGGVLEKIRAARKLEIPILVIKRPKIQYPVVFDDIEKLLKEVANKYGK